MIEEEGLTDSYSNYCSVCFEQHEIPLYSLNCGHSFCQRCIASHIMAQLDQGVIDIPCLEKGCTSTISQENIQSNLSSTEFERYEKMKFLKDSNVRFCPQCNTVNYWSIEQKEPPAKPIGNNIMTCKQCLKKFCYFHSVAHNDKTSCEEYETLLASSMEEKQTQTLLKSISKPCPKCSMLIELSEGCPLVKCLSCGTKFCYRCGQSGLQGNRFMPKCERCGLSFIDHDYSCMWMIIFGLTSPLWVPLATLYSLIILLCGMCCICCIIKDSHMRNAFMVMAFLPFFMIFMLCGWLCCLPSFILNQNEQMNQQNMREAFNQQQVVRNDSFY